MAGIPSDRLLRYFLAVAEELNFTRAAAKLHIAQPSLSAQIRQLERQLGVPLLHRSTHAVSLTEAGRVLLARGPAALAELERAWQATRDAGSGVTGQLRMAYPLSAGRDTAPRLVQALHDTHPRVELSTEVLPTPAVLTAIREGRCDVGIVRAPAATEGVLLEELRHDRLGALVSADHPLAARDDVELADLAQYRVIIHPRRANPSHYDFVVDLFTTRGLHPDLAERDIAFDLSQRFVDSGSACTLVGRSSSVGLAERLAWIPLTEPVSVVVSLARSADACSAPAERFCEVARTYAESHGWLG